jgi:HrpA-like RNA helicase
MAEHGQIKFLKPNLDYSSSLQTERLNEIESEQELAKFNTFSTLALDVQRKQLPIYKYREQILYALETHRVVIVG